VETWRELGKTLLILGIALAALGGFLMARARLPFHLGRLPGDFVYHGRHTTVYIPVATSIVLSVAFTLIFWIIGHFRR